MSPYRESLPDALRVISLLGEAAPEPARGRFLRALREQGLREIYDSEAPLEYVKAWRRPDLLARAFMAEILPGIHGPERAVAEVAVAVVTRLPGKRPRATSGQETA